MSIALQSLKSLVVKSVVKTVLMRLMETIEMMLSVVGTWVVKVIPVTASKVSLVNPYKVAELLLTKKMFWFGRYLVVNLLIFGEEKKETNAIVVLSKILIPSVVKSALAVVTTNWLSELSSQKISWALGTAVVPLGFIVLVKRRAIEATTLASYL